MSTQVQFRRGTTTQNNAFTGAQGELSVDTDLKTIRLHDGTTAGGGSTMLNNVSPQTALNKTFSTGSVWQGNAVGLGYGGTGSALTANAGSILYSTASGLALSTSGTSGQVLVSGGTGAPTFVAASSIAAGTSTLATTATNIAGGSAGQLIIQADTNLSTFITAGASGTFLRSAGAGYAPTWATADVTIGSTVISLGSSTTGLDGVDILASTGTSHWTLPAGTTAQRPGTPAAGMVRYNSSQATFEGYSSGAWSSLGGVKSVDALTYIIAETSAGASNGELEFYAEDAAGTGTVKIGGWNRSRLLESTGTILGTQTTQNLFNTVATTVNAFGAATTISLGAATGTLTVNNAKTIFNSTNSIQLPAGTTAQRDGTPVTGMVRYNSDLSTFEGYAATAWGSLGGVKSVDALTYIVAETSAGASNGDLDFFAEDTAGTAATQVGQWNRTNLKDYTGTLVGTKTTQNIFNATATAINAFGAASTIALGKDGSTVTTLQGKLTAVGTFHTSHLTTYGSLFIDGTSTNNIMQVSSLTRASGIGLWSTGGASRVYSAGDIELRVGATLRDQDTPQGGITAVTITTGTGAVSLANNLTVAGDTILTGNLTVNGTTTTINATTLTVDDKNIELGSVATPTDVTANGGGITLKGATDKTILWSSLGWNSSEDFNLVSGKVYEIDGTSVLSSTTLGSGVTASSLTSVGTIGTGTWQGTIVAPTYGGTGVNNGSSTLTLAGNVTHAGAFTQTFTATAATSVTLPTTGTLATLAGVETLTNKTLTSPVISTIVNTGTLTLPTTTGTIALGGDTHYIGTTAVTLNRASANLALTGISSITMPGSTSGTAQIIPSAVSGTTVLTLPAASGNLALTGYPNSSTSLPNGGDLMSDETFAGSTIPVDAFGIAIIPTYSLMDPVGSVVTLDLNA